MAEIKLKSDEIEQLERKLKGERASMPSDEVAMVESILRRARSAENKAAIDDPGWLFTWTYHF
jgi:hypothetical protein